MRCSFSQFHKMPGISAIEHSWISCALRQYYMYYGTRNQAKLYFNSIGSIQLRIMMLSMKGQKQSVTRCANTVTERFICLFLPDLSNRRKDLAAALILDLLLEFIAVSESAPSMDWSKLDILLKLPFLAEQEVRELSREDRLLFEFTLWIEAVKSASAVSTTEL